MTKKDRTALFAQRDLADEAVVALARVGENLLVRTNELLGKFGVTIAQYGVLRVLYVRDPDGDGLPVGEVKARLFVRGSDVTRLIDRLVKTGVVERFRDDADRRVVRVRLTDAGADLVEAIHHPLVAANNELLAPMSGSDLDELINLVGKVQDLLTAEQRRP